MPGLQPYATSLPVDKARMFLSQEKAPPGRKEQDLHLKLPETPSVTVWYPGDERQSVSALLERVLEVKPSHRSAVNRGPHLKVPPPHTKETRGVLEGDKEVIPCPSSLLSMSLLPQISKAQWPQEGVRCLTPGLGLREHL